MAKSKGNNYFLPERKCPVCGKKFLVQPYHRFKCGGKYYCKWTCYNHRNDKKAKEKKEE